MKYVNAADVLPDELLAEVAKYAGGKLLYVPIRNEKCSWGEKSGSREYFKERNRRMVEMFRAGKTLDELGEVFGLSRETIKGIVKK